MKVDLLKRELVGLTQDSALPRRRRRCSHLHDVEELDKANRALETTACRRERCSADARRTVPSG